MRSNSHRMPAWFSRILLAVVALISLGGITGLLVVLAQTRAEHARVREVERQVRVRLAEVETRLAEQEIVLERLRSDPAYVEAVIRRRLGYAKPEEFVFRFED
jgi:cell division protein DivIC